MTPIEIVKYLGVCLMVLVIYAIPTAVLYWFITQSSFRITRLEGLIIAFAGAHVVMGAWAVIRSGSLSPIMWGSLLVLMALLIWYGVRPTRGPIIALLLYVALAVAISNLLPLLTQPWGSPLHKAAFGALFLRLILAGMLVRDLRLKAAHCQPLLSGGK